MDRFLKLEDLGFAQPAGLARSSLKKVKKKSYAGEMNGSGTTRQQQTSSTRYSFSGFLIFFMITEFKLREMCTFSSDRSGVSRIC